MINEWWAVLSQIGAWGWILCTVGLILRCFPGRDRFVPSRAMRWGGGVVVMYLIWIIGLLRA